MVACVSVMLASAASAETLRLAAVWSDHAVIQRDAPIRVFGRAAPKARVDASFDEARATTTADDAGRFVLELPAQPASFEPRSLRVASGDESLAVEDLLVGEVWLCSGQSNMEWHVEWCDGAEDAANAPDSALRMFTGEVTFGFEPAADAPGLWEAATAATVARFSATAYWFGRELRRELSVPIGLVHVSWGGSAIEAWTSLEALRPLRHAQKYLDAYEKYRSASVLDPAAYAAIAVDDSAWSVAPVPSFFADLGHDGPGTIWFRREIEVPAAHAGQALRLHLGPIDDEDVTYWDGVELGRTSGWRTEREYVVPAERVRAGRAVLAVEVKNGAGPGGIYGDPSLLSLAPEAGGAAIPLAGSWRMKVGADFGMPDPRHRPAHLYHGMIHPLLDLRFRGAIWYQGESNATADRGDEYREFLPAMIADWRARFRNGDFPFLVVQLPNFAPGDDYWRYPIVRDAQLATARSTKGVGLAVTIDLGDDADIHPKNKIDVGRRLARLALHGTYGRDDVVPTGPLFRAASFAGGTARVEFDLFGSSLIGTESGAGGERTLAGFEIAGADERFVPGKARIAGDAVEVWSDEVAEPAYVRYGWHGSPPVSLRNAQGLPASPFASGPPPTR